MKTIKFLVVVLLLVIFVNPALAELYIVNDLEGEHVCITNINTLISKYKELGYEMILIPESTLLLEKSKTEAESPGAEIRIVDWTNYPSSTGNYIMVEGILENTSDKTLKYVRVKVQAFDKSYGLVSITEGYADPSTLEPNRRATFSIMVKTKPNIENIDLVVLWDY